MSRAGMGAARKHGALLPAYSSHAEAQRALYSERDTLLGELILISVKASNVDPNFKPDSLNVLIESIKRDQTSILFSKKFTTARLNIAGWSIIGRWPASRMPNSSALEIIVAALAADSIGNNRSFSPHTINVLFRILRSASSVNAATAAPRPCEKAFLPPAVFSTSTE